MSEGGHHNRMRWAAVRLRARVHETSAAIWLIKGGVRVMTSYRGVENKGMSFQFVALTAPPGLPLFRIYPAGAMKSYANKIFGAEDIPLGHARFDAALLVQGHEPELVRRVLIPERCAVLVDYFADSELHCSGDELRLLRPVRYAASAMEHDEGLDLGLRFLFDLGAADAYGREALRALPDATLQLDGSRSLPYVEITAPAALRVGFARDLGGSLVTEARLAVPEEFTVTPALVTQAELLGANPVVLSGQLLLLWPTVVRDVKILRAAVDLLRGLISGPHEGVFR